MSGTGMLGCRALTSEDCSGSITVYHSMVKDLQLLFFVEITLLILLPLLLENIGEGLRQVKFVVNFQRKQHFLLTLIQEQVIQAQVIQCNARYPIFWQLARLSASRWEQIWVALDREYAVIDLFIFFVA